MFEGPRLACLPLLKMEDFYLANHTKFLHLVNHKYMNKIYYDHMRVTILDPMKWARDVEQSRLLNLWLV